MRIGIGQPASQAHYGNPRAVGIAHLMPLGREPNILDTSRQWTHLTLV